jgi:hypothetical protein
MSIIYRDAIYRAYCYLGRFCATLICDFTEFALIVSSLCRLMLLLLFNVGIINLEVIFLHILHFRILPIYAEKRERL